MLSIFFRPMLPASVAFLNAVLGRIQDIIGALVRESVLGRLFLCLLVVVGCAEHSATCKGFEHIALQCLTRLQQQSSSPAGCHA